MKKFEGSRGGKGGKSGGFGGKGRSFGGGGSRGGFKPGGGRGFGGNDGERAVMHRATCAECGKSCEVPFRPSGDRPVLCHDCFSGSKGDYSSRKPERSFKRDSFGDKQMFAATCAECGERCEVPFRPSGDKPVLCSNCFGHLDKSRDKSFGTNNSNNTPIERQLHFIEKKLDEILAKLGD